MTNKYDDDDDDDHDHDGEEDGCLTKSTDRFANQTEIDGQIDGQIDR